jgi:putative RNA 2'-phosphotransferase
VDTLKEELSHLSRTISHALRHEPWLYELELDEEGWVEVEALLAALRSQRHAWHHLAQQDLIRVMEASDKRRFELCGGLIRALYGHSTPQRLRKVPAEPPAVLYHGTTPTTAQIILAEGLKPMHRQYVHLSIDRATAYQVGRRKTREPLILQVAAEEAHTAGVVFYKGNEQVWLADYVPAAFLRTGE